MDDRINDLEYVAIRTVGDISYKTYRNLIENNVITSHRELNSSFIDKFPTIKNKFKLSNRTIDSIERTRKKLDDIKIAVEDYISRMEKNSIDVISCEDDDYPYHWKVLSGMPKVIFVKGQKEILNHCETNGSVSIVGTRIPSGYSSKATRDFTQRLSEKKIVIVSGGALGIDKIAHETAIESNGETIMVSPCGLDISYPYENKPLFNRIFNKGLAISEMPPGCKPLKQYFPSRNRLIAGLSDVCLVMEAGLKSGTLHTATFAGVQGKDVFVLPNSIYLENALGGLNLLRDGANVLSDVNDVIDEVATSVFYRIQKDILENKSLMDFNLVRKKIEKNTDKVTVEEWKFYICEKLHMKPMTIDELISDVNVPYTMVALYLSELEADGKIESVAGKYALTFS